MRFWGLLFFTFRILLRVWFIYNLTKLLSLPKRTAARKNNARKSARLVADFFQDQAGIFIKAAQFVGNISNLFEEGISEEFERVKDSVTPETFSQVRHRFLTEFGKEPEELFSEFNHQAIAAASIGQVHVARLHDGRKVVVKFLHAGLETQVRQDLQALRFACRLIRLAFPRLDFTRHLREFTQMVSAEMDFLHEAENLRLLRQNFSEDPRVIIPNVVPDRSGRTVITIEYIKGVSIDDKDALLAAGVNLHEITELLLETYIRMIFEHQFFHADPHPGNIIILPADGVNPLRLGFYDFGAAETVTTTMIRTMQAFLYILRQRNIPQLADLAVDAGFLQDDANLEPFRELFEIIYARYGGFKTQRFKEINPMRLGRVFTFRDMTVVNLRFRTLVREFHVPRRYLYLARTFTYIIAIAQKLDPSVNIFQVGRPYVDKYVLPTPKKLRDLLKRGTWQTAYEKIMSNYYSYTYRRNRHGGGGYVNPNLMYGLGHQAMALVGILAGTFVSFWLYTGGEVKLATYSLSVPAFSFAALFYSLLKTRQFRDRR